MEHYDALKGIENGKVMIAVTQRGGMEDITGFLDEVSGCQYFSF